VNCIGLQSGTDGNVGTENVGTGLKCGDWTEMCGLD
jgi:hypothetical protein